MVVSVRPEDSTSAGNFESHAIRQKTGWCYEFSPASCHQWRGQDKKESAMQPSNWLHRTWEITSGDEQRPQGVTRLPPRSRLVGGGGSGVDPDPLTLSWLKSS